MHFLLEMEGTVRVKCEGAEAGHSRGALDRRQLLCHSCGVPQHGTGQSGVRTSTSSPSLRRRVDEVFRGRVKTPSFHPAHFNLHISMQVVAFQGLRVIEPCADTKKPPRGDRGPHQKFWKLSDTREMCTRLRTVVVALRNSRNNCDSGWSVYAPIRGCACNQQRREQKPQQHPDPSRFDVSTLCLGVYGLIAIILVCYGRSGQC